MRNINKDTITEAALASISNTSNPRTLEVLSAMIRHLHAFVKEVKLTNEEWQVAMDLLQKAAKITDDNRSEFILFSDTLGVSALVDLVAEDFGVGTETSLLGPFYIPGAPKMGYGANLAKCNDGTRVVVQGKITDLDGKPISNATIDLWQNAANGLYQVLDPDQDLDNLRCVTNTNDNGEYLFATIKPVTYPVPDDGPVGDMLRATNRHPQRTAHIHFFIQADGYKPLVTELFPDDDPYLEEDAVFGVREALVVPFAKADPSEASPMPGIEHPFLKVNFDFRLQPA
ncbi:MAG: dioxygenase [Rhodospirillaceae bacterium]